MKASHKLIYLLDLLYTLSARELKLRYKRSILGFGWSLLNPLAQLVVLSFVFRLIVPLGIPHYTVFLFIGMLSWTWFQAALYQATDSITGNRELVRRPGFQIAILPVITVTTHLVHYILAFPVVLLFLGFNRIHITGAVLLLPIVWALQFALTLGLAYPLAAIHVVFRDTQYLLGVFLLLGFYITPIFYDSGVIPDQYQVIYRINPMVHLIGAYRSILLDGQIPQVMPLILIGIFSGLLLFFGYRFFKRGSYRFVEEL